MVKIKTLPAIILIAGMSVLGMTAVAHAGPAHHAPSAGLTAAVRFTGGGKGPGRCKWHANGSKDAGTVRIRLTLDHCKRTQMRLRAAGESALPDTWHTGNWVDKVHQLTSINISPEVYADYGYDLQYCWRGCKHKGHVRYISTDPGAGSPVARNAWTTAAMVPAVPGGQIITIPYCQHNADLCLESMGLHYAHADNQVVAGIELKTKRIPKYLEITTRFWYKDLEGWHPERIRHYTKHDLPKTGEKGWLHPGLRESCKTGRWELTAAFIGHTSKGAVRTEYFYWPASRTKKDKVVASDKVGGISSKFFLGLKVICHTARPVRLTSALIPAVHVTKFFIRNGAGGDMAYLNKAGWLTTSGVKRHGLKFEETDVAACTKAQGIRCFELKTVGTDKCVTRAHRRHRTYAGYKILPCKKLKTQLFFYNQIKTPGHTLIDAKYNDCMEGFELEYNLADPKCMPISQGQESWYFRTRF